MSKHLITATLAACLLTVGACGKGADSDDTTNTTADTSTIRGVDSVGGAAVPTTDTVIKTTTTDTLQGKASDSAKAKRDTGSKKP